MPFQKGNTIPLTHGQTKTRLYMMWAGMKQRCSNPRHEVYRYYGGRGIRVCDVWQESFEAFRDWALSHGYRAGLQIDRKDANLDYTPENCRWVTKKVQANNRRDTNYAEIFGERKPVGEWASDPRCKVSAI